MPLAHLEDRAILTVSGPEAEHFLQNLITADLSKLKDGEARPAALLSPQGKILFDFLISRAGESAFRLECRSDVADDFLRRLMLYRLRAKVEIARAPAAPVAVIWGTEGKSGEEPQTFVDTRFAEPVLRCYNPPIPERDAGATDWHVYRIASGIAESGTDYALGDAFPHDVLLDQLAGIGFQKGCYIGQEVVSRMQHRGTAKRRVLIVHGESPLPASGTEISASGRTLGTLGSASGKDGLAIVRIDRVKDAMDRGEPISAGGVPVTLVIPEWAKFGYPEPAADAGSGA
jgi:folate-binding protein YgfZ